jgi:hypothetical protein
MNPYDDNYPTKEDINQYKKELQKYIDTSSDIEKERNRWFISSDEKHRLNLAEIRNEVWNKPNMQRIQNLRNIKK